MRQRADGVQVETVVAAAPWLPHTPALDDSGVYPARPEGRRNRQPSRTCADDDDIVHAAKATDSPAASRSRLAA
jgi:hypothetical protein